MTPRATTPRKLSAGERQRAFVARQQARRVARFDALRLMAETPAGIPPAKALGRDIGLLVGLEVDGFAVRLAQRDPRLGDLLFVITDEGRRALEDCKGLL